MIQGPGRSFNRRS